jgi:phage shock protein C
MYCTRCGAQNTDGARYCTVCGASLITPAEGPGYPAIGGAPAYSTAPQRRLKRILAEKKIAGVCAGFAEYFDMDVTLVRLIWFGVSLMSGIVPGVMVYIVAWIVLPRG